MSEASNNKYKLESGDKVTVTKSHYTRSGEVLNETYEGIFLHDYKDGTCAIEVGYERRREPLAVVSLFSEPEKKKEKGKILKFLERVGIAIGVGIATNEVDKRIFKNK